MHSRATELIRSLGLEGHPEGGFYRQVFLSPNEVRPSDGQPHRSALSAIHFLLAAGGHSRWHRLQSDEVWIHVEGASVDLWILGGEPQDMRHLKLGPLAAGGEPMRIVRAGAWQAGESTGDYSLVACVVGPGFEFEDLTFMDEDSVDARMLRARWPQLARFL